MSDFSTLNPRNVHQKHSSKERLMPTYFGPKWGSMTKTGPEEAHKSETTSLYHGAVGTCSRFICIKNLGRSKRVLHQLWKPCAQRQAQLPPWCHMPRVAPLPEQHCHRGVVLFETWADWNLPKKRFSACHCDSRGSHVSCHVTKRLHCQTVCCSPQTSWHNSLDKLPTMFLHMHKWLLHCPFCKHEMSLPLPFSSTLGAQVWLRHHFEPENLQANFASKGLGG